MRLNLADISLYSGTFYNDAVLRSFERIANCEAIRPDIAGIMGAFGAALIARERYEDGKETTMLSIDKINELKYTTSMANCRGCTNNCRLTINKFQADVSLSAEIAANEASVKKKQRSRSESL